MRASVRSFALPRWLPVVVLVALIVLIAASAIAKPGDDKDKPESGTFEISGSADGFLYPSVDQVLPVKIENPFKRDIEVTLVTITVGDASPSCTAANVTVGEVPMPVLIEAGEDHIAEVPIVMPPDAANECQGAVFPITYEGVARRS